MRKTFKKSTYFFIGAILFAPFLLMPITWNLLGINLNQFGIAVFTTPIFAVLAFLSYRGGKAVATTSGNQSATVQAIPTSAPIAAAAPASHNPMRKMAIGAVAVVAVLLVGYGVRSGHLFVAGISKPALEGAYRDQKGGKVEFLGGGTVIATSATSTDTARWTLLDDTRIKFEPESIGFLGQVCEYRFRDYRNLTIANCVFSMNLTRM